jgi:hypothetical protein
MRSTKTTGPAPVPDEGFYYRAHLLRYWREHQSPSAWRFSLEDVRTGERRGFADLDALIAFLHAEITRSSTPKEDKP